MEKEIAVSFPQLTHFFVKRIILFGRKLSERYSSIFQNSLPLGTNGLVHNWVNGGSSGNFPQLSAGVVVDKAAWTFGRVVFEPIPWL
jgi:hypothetical protein